MYEYVLSEKLNKNFRLKQGFECDMKSDSSFFPNYKSSFESFENFYFLQVIIFHQLVKVTYLYNYFRQSYWEYPPFLDYTILSLLEGGILLYQYQYHYIKCISEINNKVIIYLLVLFVYFLYFFLAFLSNIQFSWELCPGLSIIWF